MSMAVFRLFEKLRYSKHLISLGRIRNMDGGPWTTPNFQKEIAPVNKKIYWMSGYEKHRLVFIAYVLEGLSRKSGLLWDRAS